MSSLRSCSNEALLAETKTWLQKEREATLKLIECLEEVQGRMLYAKLGFASLWAFCTGYLGLSEGAAQRRIAAMRVSREVPEVMVALSEGRVSLSNVAKLDTFFAIEKKEGRPKTCQQKREIVQQIEGLSKAACEKKLFGLSPSFELSQKEVLRPISADQNTLKLVLDSKVVAQLNLLRSRLAHSHSNASYSELIALLVEEKLGQIEKKRGAAVGAAARMESSDHILQESKEASQIDCSSEVVPNGVSESDRKSSPVAPVMSPVVPLLARADLGQNRSDSTPVNGSERRGREEVTAAAAVKARPSQRKAISMEVRRAIWRRSGGRCEYRAPDGRRCGSVHALEVDHIRSVVRDGSDEASNLRHLCRKHNQWAAIEDLGEGWMSEFLPVLNRTSSS